MKLTTTLDALILVGLASTTAARKCQNITVPVTISARNGVFDLKAPKNDIEVTNFILNLAQQGGNYTQKILKNYATVSGIYNLATTYCEPDSGPSHTVQLLTHGIGFDRSYWDLPFNNFNYSYIAQAVDQYHYSTLTWDRLGIGASSHGEPVNEIQALLEVAALAELTKYLRKGLILNVPRGTPPGIGGFQKVVHVGHSFGSVQSYALTAQNPGASDGIVLTGFSQNGSFVPYFLLGGNFVSAPGVDGLSGKYVDGYLAAGDKSAVHTNFFAPKQFDPKILDYAYQNGQPTTVGELLTIGGAAASVNKFKGPVLVITGDRDIPFCGGNCTATGRPDLPSIPAASKQFIPEASDFQAVIVPGAGHGLNMEYSHPYTYGKILDFLVSHGLSP